MKVVQYKQYSIGIFAHNGSGFRHIICAHRDDQKC